VRDSHRRNTALRVDNARLQETIRNLRSRRHNPPDESTPLVDVSHPADAHNHAADDANESTLLANVETPTLPPMEGIDMLVDVEPELDEDFPHLRRMPGRLFRARTLRSPPPPVVDASSSHHTTHNVTSTLPQNMLDQGSATPNPLQPAHADETTDLDSVRDWTFEQRFPTEVAANTARIYQAISRLWRHTTRARGRIAAEQTRLSNRTETLRVAQDKISDVQERFMVFVGSMQAHVGRSSSDFALGETMLPTIRTMTSDLEGIEPSIRDVLGGFGLTLDAEADRRRFIVEPPYNLRPDHALHAARHSPEDVLATSRTTARAQEEEAEEEEEEEEEREEVEGEEEEDEAQSPIGRWRASLTASDFPSTTDFTNVITPHIARVTSAVARSTTQQRSRRLESLNRLARAQTSLEEKIHEHQEGLTRLRPRAEHIYNVVPGLGGYGVLVRVVDAERKLGTCWNEWATQALAIRKLYVEFEENEDESAIAAERMRPRQYPRIELDQQGLECKLAELDVERRAVEGMVASQARAEA